MSTPLLDRGQIWRLKAAEGQPPRLVLVLTPSAYASRLSSVMVVFLTDRHFEETHWHVPLTPLPVYFQKPLWIRCESLLMVTISQFDRQLGTVPPTVLTDVHDWLDRFLGRHLFVGFPPPGGP